MSSPQLVTVAVAAALCEVWPDTVRQWLNKGKLTRYRFGTGIRVDLVECRTLKGRHRAHARNVSAARFTTHSGTTAPRST